VTKLDKTTVARFQNYRHYLTTARCDRTKKLKDSTTFKHLVLLDRISIVLHTNTAADFT